MADEAAVKEVSIDTLEMPEFKAARAKGEVTVQQKVPTAGEEPDKKIESGDEGKEQEPKEHWTRKQQKRFDNLVKQIAVAEQERDAAKKRADEAEAKTGGKHEEKAPAIEGEPQRENFQTEVEYVKALTRWEVKQEMKEQREVEEKEAVAAANKERVEAYNKKAIEASSRYNDWKEVMSQDIDLPSIVGDAIVHTIKNGPDVAYYLGQHPEVCEEMVGVHPLHAVAMAVAISEKLSAAEKKEPAEDKELEPEPEKQEAKTEKPKSKAPAPITPVSGGVTRSSVPMDEMSQKDYNKARAAGRLQ